MGPLTGVKIIEMAGIGPCPFAAMLLADMGADIIRIDRPSKGGPGIDLPHRKNVLHRGRRSVAINMKDPGAAEVVLKLCESADGIMEGFRPGVMERLGLSPDVCLARNKKIVFGRMTGWGQDGPMAQVAGHDIDYIALAGVLHTIGPRGGKPVPPLNLVGDFGGGGMFLAFGMLCGILEARQSGRGQVVDAAMVEGAALLANILHSFRATDYWRNERGTNILDGGAHFYDTYETKDGKAVAIGAIEPQFYARLLELMGLDQKEFEPQLDQSRWPAWKQRFAAVFRTKTRDEWAAILEPEEACGVAVLTPDEAIEHPHNRAREVFVEFDGTTQVAPAPRFSRTQARLDLPSPEPGEHSVLALTDWGFDADEIERLQQTGIVV